MKRYSDTLFCVFYFLLIFNLVLNAQNTRGRVQIQNGTIVTDKGTLLRGCFDRNYYIRDIDWESHKQDIHKIKEYGLNCIHTYIGEVSDGFFESDPAYWDSIVKWTRIDSLYLILTPYWKDPEEESNMTLVENFQIFWRKIATRYKNETHVFFEIANEPQLYNAPYDSIVLFMERTVYDTIRKYAPETHIMFMSYSKTINADSAIMEIKSLGDGIDWSNASVSVHGYTYSSETTREFIHALQDSGYAVVNTECPSIGDGWITRYMNMAFLRVFEEEFISSIYFLRMKQILEFPDGYIKQIESSDIRWHPDFGTWPESLTSINYINPYQPVQTGFYDKGANIQHFTDSIALFHVEDDAYLAFFNLNFNENTDTFIIECSGMAEHYGSVDILIDSLNGPLAGTCNLPRTSSDWYKMITYSCPVSIPEGIHNIFLLFHSDNWPAAGVLKSMLFVVEGVNSKKPPYSGIAFNLPGKIEAEEFDNGGKNISYFDSTPGNDGLMFRDNDVDIENTTDIGQGYNIGYIDEGEWIEFSVTSLNTYIMDIQFRIACVDAGEKIKIKLNNQILGTVTLPNTGGFQNWRTITLEDVTIPAGENQFLRLEFLESGFNINWLNFVEKQVLDLDKTKSCDFIILFPNPAKDIITIQSEEKGIMEIYSIQGQLLQTEKFIAGKQIISVKYLESGNFIIRLKTQREIYSEQLIIQ